MVWAQVLSNIEVIISIIAGGSCCCVSWAVVQDLILLQRVFVAFVRLFALVILGSVRKINRDRVFIENLFIGRCFRVKASVIW